MGNIQIPDISEVKSKVQEIKKMIVKLYDRSIIPKPIVTDVVPEVYVENIWEIPKLVEEP